LASFEERMGLVEPRSVMQTDFLNSVTRTDIGNVFYRLRRAMYDDDGGYSYLRYADQAADDLWANHFRLSLNQYSEARAWTELQRRVEEGTWAEALSVLDALVKAMHKVDERHGLELADSTRHGFNTVFEANLVGYRFVDYELVPITNSIEMESIEDALVATEEFEGAQAHLANALQLLSLQGGHKYAKSVSESISAVEAIVRHFTGAATLGAGVKLLRAKGVDVHPSLADGWSKIYGYTNDAGGVRHGSVEASKVDEPLATYFLVTCSAFVNLLIKYSLQTSDI